MSDKRPRDRADRPTWLSQHVPTEILGSKLFKFKVKLVDGTTVTVDITNDIEIDYERLEEQMDQVTGQYVWWSSIYSEVRAMVTLLERRIKIRRGVLVEAALTTARDIGARLTDKQAEKVVETDEMLNKWEVQLAVLQKNTGKLFHMVQAIQMKSELLRSRSGFKRQEREQQR